MNSMYLMKTYRCCCLIAQLLADLKRCLSGKLLLILLSLLLASLLILNCTVGFISFYQKLSVTSSAKAFCESDCYRTSGLAQRVRNSVYHSYSISLWFLFLRLCSALSPLRSPVCFFADVCSVLRLSLSDLFLRQRLFNS
jgi:hypothetical protein